MSEELREKARLQGPWKQETVDGREVWAVKYTTELGNVLELEHSTAEGAREWMSITATRHPSIIRDLLDERDSLLSANEGMRKALEWAKSRFDAISIDCQGASICGEPEMGLEAIYHRASDARREIDAALSPALNSKLAPAGEGEENG